MARPEDWPADDLSTAPPLRRFAQGLVSAALRAGGLKVSGLEHVPERGPLLVCGNHVSYLDPLALAVAIGKRRYLRGLAKVELYDVPALGWFLRRAGTIPLDRGRGDVGAMRAALSLLEKGGCLGLFPEGTRSRTGKPGKARAGAGFLAGHSGAPVVPVHILGTQRALPRRLEVRFGEPMTFSGDASDGEACRRFSQAVLDRVFKL